jgi:hypothetical protein
MPKRVSSFVSVLVLSAALAAGCSSDASEGATGQPPAATDPPGTPANYWAELNPAAGTARSLPTRLFPADNWWNLNVSQAPVDPKSSAYIKALASVRLSYDWGNNYGIPFIAVSGNYPKIRFQGGYYWSQSDDVGYPLPIPALSEPGWTEDLSGTISNPVSKGDRHLLIVDVDNQYLYEIYQPIYNATDSPVVMADGQYLQPRQYYCASAAMWDMKTNNTRPEGWTSSDAAGLQLLPGLVKYDEVAGTEPIAHAHRMTLNMSASAPPLYVWPATHAAGSWSADHPPLGARFRLKASKDLSGFGPNARKVLQSMKDYGVIFADNGPNGMITGTNDARWGNFDSEIRMEFATAFSQVRLDDFEVVQLGWRPAVPKVTWPAPAPAVQGAALTSTQLNASASVPGTFAYVPPAGTVLPAGTHTLTATFTPSNTSAYAVAVATVSFTVNRLP